MHRTLTYIISLVWLVNGLYCKVLDQVPRHQEIVERIVGEEYAQTLTCLIGLSEIVMAVWVFSSYRSRLNAIVQMIIVATMNIIEFLVVPDLLLWGHLNSIFALCFIGVVYYNEFVLGQKSRT